MVSLTAKALLGAALLAAPIAQAKDLGGTVEEVGSTLVSAMMVRPIMLYLQKCTILHALGRLFRHKVSHSVALLPRIAFGRSGCDSVSLLRPVHF